MDIGARLKEARVSKGLSLDELQEMTKIQKRYLSAIEEGKLEILPGKFYAKAFIKEYANAVGIDPDELLKEHQGDMPQTETEEPTSVELSRMERSRKENVEKNTKLFSLFPTVIVVLLVIGIVMVIWFFKDGFGSNQVADGEEVLDDTEIIINNPNDINGNEADEEAKDENVEADEVEETEEDLGKETDEVEEDLSEETDEENLPTFTVIEEGSGSSPQSILELNHVGEEITVTFDTETRTWLDVENDEGVALFSSTLETENSPFELELDGTSEIYLNIGNASDLKITINGVELPYPIDPNEYVHQQIRIHIPEETE